jgi:hypothetical protein
MSVETKCSRKYSMVHYTCSESLRSSALQNERFGIDLEAPDDVTWRKFIFVVEWFCRTKICHFEVVVHRIMCDHARLPVTMIGPDFDQIRWPIFPGSSYFLNVAGRRNLISLPVHPFLDSGLGCVSEFWQSGRLGTVLRKPGAQFALLAARLFVSRLNKSRPLESR